MGPSMVMKGLQKQFLGMVTRSKGCFAAEGYGTLQLDGWFIEVV